MGMIFLFIRGMGETPANFVIVSTIIAMGEAILAIPVISCIDTVNARVDTPIVAANSGNKGKMEENRETPLPTRSTAKKTTIPSINISTNLLTGKIVNIRTIKSINPILIRPCEKISAHIISTTTDIQIFPKPSQKQSMDFNASRNDFFIIASMIPTIKKK